MVLAIVLLTKYLFIGSSAQVTLWVISFMLAFQISIFQVSNF